MVDCGIHEKLAAIILELYDVLSSQEHGCRILDLQSPELRDAVTDRAQYLMNSWHELHEFDEEAHSNPLLVRALLIMYSDTVASYHEAMAHAGTSEVIRNPYALPKSC